MFFSFLLRIFVFGITVKFLASFSGKALLGEELYNSKTSLFLFLARGISLAPMLSSCLVTFSCVGNKMLLSRALDAWSHSRDYFSRAYLAPVSLAMYWFVFSRAWNPSPVSSTRFLLSSQRIFNQSLQHHRSCRPVASKA